VLGVETVGTVLVTRWWSVGRQGCSDEGPKVIVLPDDAIVVAG